ncbi:MAG: adenylate/guanylate cyclase domain-containing protein [Polyangiales bacterium]
MAKLVITGPEGQMERDLSAVNTLGRHPNNSIQLLDRIVSKEHCVVEQRGARWVLRDLGSLNGTYVNDQRVAGEAVLHHGDQITLGGTRAVFHDPAGALTGPNPAAATMPTPLAGAGGGAVIAPALPVVSPAQIGASSAPAVPPRPPLHVPAPAAATTPGPGLQQLRNVTIGGAMMESHVRSKIAAELQQFLPERSVQDVDALRRDYEKLRISYELQRSVGAELDLDRLMEKILERSFDLLSADRGVILLFEDGELKPRCSRARRPGPEELVVSRAVVGQVVKEKVAVLSSDAKLDPRFSESKSIIMTGIRSSMAVPLLHRNELLGVMMVDSQNPNAFGEKDLQLFTNIATQAALSIANASLARRIEEEALARARFQRLLSPAIAELVVSGKVEVKQGGEPRVTTMLFSDIRGFTSRSETMRAEDIVAMLNDYFERMVEIVFRHEGTLDKFVGDEIMALFGAPVSHPDDAQRAVRTALAMLDELRRFNAEREAQGQPTFGIGIGINTGDVVAGYIGSSKAMQYTVIGAPVNLAARLCSAAQSMQVLIAETTWSKVRDRFEVRELEPVKPKGIAQPVRVFEVLREHPPHGAETSAG